MIKKSLLSLVLFYLFSGLFPVVINDEDTELDALKALFPWITQERYRIITRYAQIYSVKPELIYAIIEHESGGESKALSYMGARGIMQVMPFHFPQDPNRLLRDDDLNVRIGVSYLSSCLKIAGGIEGDAVRMYNSGPNMPREVYPVKLWEGYVLPVLQSYKNAKKLTLNCRNYLTTIANRIQYGQANSISQKSYGQKNISAFTNKDLSSLSSHIALLAIPYIKEIQYGD